MVGKRTEVRPNPCPNPPSCPRAARTVEATAMPMRWIPSTRARHQRYVAGHRMESTHVEAVGLHAGPRSRAPRQYERGGSGLGDGDAAKESGESTANGDVGHVAR